jgi:lysophospholipase L1-like esterase
VERSQLDTLLVVAVLLFLLSLIPESVVGPSPPQGDAVAVALGDSYMSGEGAEAFYEGTDDADVNECRRAPTSWVTELVDATDRFSGLASYACSGAKAAHLWDIPQHPGEPVGTDSPNGLTQLQQLTALLEGSGASRVTAIFLTIGGNDAGFSTIGATCAAPGNCAEKADLWMDNMKNVRGALSKAYSELNTVLDKYSPGVPVVQVPYPTPLFEQACGEVALEQREIDFIIQFLDRLNTVIRQEGDQAGFLYVDEVEDSLDGGNARLCEPGGEVGINFLGWQSMNGTFEEQFNPANWLHGSFHPNEHGHDILRATMTTWLDQNVPLQPTAREEGTIDDDVDVDPPCDLYNISGVDCRQEARDWAAGQLIGLWWPQGVGVLVGLAGAWLLWVAIIAQWRRSVPGQTHQQSAGTNS